MLKTETIQGPIDVETTVHRIEVYIADGRLRFATLQQCYKDGVQFGIGEMRQYDSTFADLPASFLVDVDGNQVQVSGQTILNALEAVAKAVIEAQETP